VQQLAEALELAIKAGQSPVELAPLLDTLQQSLDPLVQAIAQRLPQVQVVTPAAPVAIDEAELSRVTQRLRGLLADMDSDATDWLERHRGVLSSAFPAHLSAIESALQAFEFDAAAEQLAAGMAARAAA
jgi:hypothetical protein